MGADLGSAVRGAISSATVGPDPSHVMVALGSSEAVAMMDLDTVPPYSDPAYGFESRLLGFVDVAANPSGIAITEEGTSWVQERGTRSVAELPVSDTLNGMDAASADGRRLDTFHALDRLAAGTSSADPDVEAGRALFTSAVDPAVTFPGLGVSCDTCHVDGRNDGLTWAFDETPRQTPSLVGGLAATLPVTWTEAIPTVADEALMTAIGRMGGTGLSVTQAAQIATFVDQLRDVDLPAGDEALVALGATIAERPEVGCSSCHSGPRRTDNARHPMFGDEVDTPSLVGVAATPPYFHDGRAPTLRDVLELSRDGSMGSTADLDDLEMDALEAWLSSL